MYLPAFPTETEIDAAYPMLPNPHDCECFAALQRAERLSRVLELLGHIPLNALDWAMVHGASERSSWNTAARKDGVWR